MANRQVKNDLIAAVVFIVFGIFSLTVDIQAAVLLIAVGLAMSSQIRKWIWEGFSWVFEKLTKSETTNSQTAKRIRGPSQQVQAKKIGKVEQKVTYVYKEERKKRKR